MLTIVKVHTEKLDVEGLQKILEKGLKWFSEEFVNGQALNWPVVKDMLIENDVNFDNINESDIDLILEALNKIIVLPEMFKLKIDKSSVSVLEREAAVFYLALKKEE